MTPRFAPQFVDHLYTDAPIDEFYGTLGIIERHAPLPPASWLLCRLVEWMSTTRSGIWTYYEAVPEPDQREIVSVLGNFPTLEPLAIQYSKGREVWKRPRDIAHVDSWIDADEHEMKALLLALAREERGGVEKLLRLG
jgi:hypothetical protein